MPARSDCVPKSAPGSSFFPPQACEPCPLRGACIAPAHAHRTLEVGPHEALFIEARRYAKTDAYRDDRRKRLIVERQIARVARLGARFARFFGQAKVRVQVALIAAVANLARLATVLAART
jgi:IS5 family transposase